MSGRMFVGVATIAVVLVAGSILLSSDETPVQVVPLQKVTLSYEIKCEKGLVSEEFNSWTKVNLRGRVVNSQRVYTFEKGNFEYVTPSEGCALRSVKTFE